MFLTIVMMSALFVPHHSDALGLSPVRIEISGNPGETVANEMLLTNETKKEETYYSSYANFEAQGETGNPSLVVPKDGLGTWMKTEASITLGPNTSQVVKVSIKIPRDAEPGGHFGAIMWGTTPNTPGNGVAIGAKTAMLVLLSVTGDVQENGGLIEFSTKNHKIWYNTLPVSFVYRFRNDGGDRIKPVGKITMHNIIYLPADRIDANPSAGNILPGTTRRFEVDWHKYKHALEYAAPAGIFAQFFDSALYQWKNFAIGPYFAKLNLLYGTDAIRVSKYAFFFVFPWQLIICLVLIIMTLWLGGKKLIKRYNRYIIKKARAGMNMPNDASHV